MPPPNQSRLRNQVMAWQHPTLLVVLRTCLPTLLLTIVVDADTDILILPLTTTIMTTGYLG